MIRKLKVDVLGVVENFSGEMFGSGAGEELAEEMGLRVTPTHELWTCTTRSNVHLTWWQCTAECLASITPNSDEVSAYFWVTPQELLDFSDLLTSNREFLAAWSLGDVPLVGIVSPHNEG